MRNYSVANQYNVSYYLHILEVEFVQFLQTEGASEKTRKNYLSDLRNFLRWVFTQVQIKNLPPQSPAELMQRLTADVLGQYRDYLLDYHVPKTTVNRRLSTLRSFFHFCLSRGLATTNPALTLRNIQETKVLPRRSKETLLTDFSEYLLKEGASKSTVKNYLTDVRQFLAWKQKHQPEEFV